ncbi:hypothetical protein HMPREF0645_0398 [Hallella bergensis DSM 17361]|uniref:DUF4271 domain-containing protein n=1 Tax=Hallella bergensis DSM 17361 TaxID=585502 RepID=D1PTW3_9BACT|nr:DUF4271 domain-containing protein [Hallella bergensis]EFA45171.1 hypothetical protein HMPREF0645_0398 [Hallella bergensis DSM 17361]
MTQQDSLSTSPTATAEAPIKASAHSRSGYHTPHEIISRLPATATPWQQDSILRANYKFPKVDWSSRANPMKTPLGKADKVLTADLAKPMYHGKSLVQPDSTYIPEHVVYHQGVAGDPIPYNIANDNLITSILLGCFILAAVSIAQTGNFIQRHFKNFFRTPSEGTTVITETGNELHFQYFLLLQTSLLFALVFFFYSKTMGNGTTGLPQYLVIGIYTGIIIAYILTKALFYNLVGWVFFDRKKNEQWTKSGLFLTATEGVVLFPIVMLHAYFNFSIETTAIYTIIVIILAKVLALYKTYIIFFEKNTDFVQSFLYFCTLEVVPLGVLWGVLVFMDDYLKVNF